MGIENIKIICKKEKFKFIVFWSNVEYYLCIIKGGVVIKYIFGVDY